MPDYSIRRQLLSPSQMSRLQQLGAEFYASGLKLAKELSRREMLEVWGIVLDLRKRTKDRGEDDGDSINWAIGDWLNAAEDRFGSFLKLVTASGIPRPRAIISYKHQDAIRDGWVRKMVTDLRERWGIDVRLDEFEVNYGESFSDYMTSEIDRDSDALLFVITPAAVAAVDKQRSGALHFEIQLANSRRLREPAFRMIGIYRESSETPSYFARPPLHRFLRRSGIRPPVAGIGTFLVGTTEWPPSKERSSSLSFLPILRP